MLGEAYQRLWGVELAVATNGLAVRAAERRFLQAVFAYQHAAIARPEMSTPQAALVPLYFEHGDLDLALRHIDQLNESLGQYTLTPRSDPNFAANQQQAKRLRTELVQRLDETRKAVEAAQAGGVVATVRTAVQMGCPALALELLEADLTLVVDSPELSMEFVRLLLLCGRTDEGLEQGLRLLHSWEGTQLYDSLGSRLLPIVATACLAADEYGEATKYWERAGRERVKRVIDTYLSTVPGVAAPGTQADSWPIFQIMTAAESLGQWIPDWELSTWQVAMNDLESGRNKAAAWRLETVLASNSTTLLRPQIAMYLTMLTGSPVAAAAPVEAAAEGTAMPPRNPDRPPSPAMPIRP